MTLIRFLGLAVFWSIAPSIGVAFAIAVILGVLSLHLGTILYTFLLFIPFLILPVIGMSGIIGMLVAVMSVTLFQNASRKVDYRRTAFTFTFVISMLALFVFYWEIGHFYSVTGKFEIWVAFICALVATLPVLYGIHRVTMWYLSSIPASSELQ